MNGFIMASNRLLSLLVYLALIIISVHTIDSVIRTSFYFSMATTVMSFRYSVLDNCRGVITGLINACFNQIS